MARGDRRLHLVRTGLPTPQRGVEDSRSLGDRVGVPPGAVLVFEQHQVAGTVDACRSARVVQEHQREQAQGFGFVGHQLGERSRQPDGLGAEVGAHEVGAGRRPNTPR